MRSACGIPLLSKPSLPPLLPPRPSCPQGQAHPLPHPRQEVVPAALGHRAGGREGREGGGGGRGLRIQYLWGECETVTWMFRPWVIALVGRREGKEGVEAGFCPLDAIFWGVPGGGRDWWKLSRRARTPPPKEPQIVAPAGPRLPPHHPAVAVHLSRRSLEGTSAASHCSVHALQTGLHAQLLASELILYPAPPRLPAPAVPAPTPRRPAPPPRLPAPSSCPPAAGRAPPLWLHLHRDVLHLHLLLELQGGRFPGRFLWGASAWWAAGASGGRGRSGGGAGSWGGVFTSSRN